VRILACRQTTLVLASEDFGSADQGRADIFLKLGRGGRGPKILPADEGAGGLRGACCLFPPEEAASPTKPRAEHMRKGMGIMAA
jgi:hypothetical protein